LNQNLADSGTPPRFDPSPARSRQTRRLAAARSLARYAPQELKPGANFQSDDELVRAAGEIGTTIFHPVGTAKMGLAQDPFAVVDELLRVHGLMGLRVVDA
jgi:choline dehydrogenase